MKTFPRFPVVVLASISLLVPAVCTAAIADWFGRGSTVTLPPEIQSFVADKERQAIKVAAEAIPAPPARSETPAARGRKRKRTRRTFCTIRRTSTAVIRMTAITPK